MKIDTATIEKIENIIRTARGVGIEEVIIEKELVRAIDEKRRVAINYEPQDLDLPFDSLGLTRIDVFLSRLDIVSSQENFSIEAVVDSNKKFVKSLLMTAKGIKVDFRCADPEQMSAPRKINDQLKSLVPIDAEAVVLLQKAQSAMGAETVTITGNQDGVSFEMYDVNNDKFTNTYKCKIEPIEDDDIEFVHTYPLKIVLPLFKENAGGHFAVGAKGIMNIRMNGIDLFVLPQAG